MCFSLKKKKKKKNRFAADIFTLHAKRWHATLKERNDAAGRY